MSIKGMEIHPTDKFSFHHDDRIIDRKTGEELYKSLPKEWDGRLQCGEIVNSDTSNAYMVKRIEIQFPDNDQEVRNIKVYLEINK
ncbi:hypothetical protein [Halobacillus sp. A5]|uniref:hypothetical protein n=1 Tax=Halobacillus sp. A5 TaxID=2880263 RepID=UPI0020A69F20|nr:hypothetical protein [Halobacillus sp. A5]MCP3025403.1 hypothetical protein [Halobacillus sp. A5]